MKNYDHVATVDKSKHAKLRVRQDPVFDHAKTVNLASISLGELGACVCNYPVVFVPHPQNPQQFRLVAMLGLRPGENSYYGKDSWDCTYVPLVIQRHPFLIGFDDREEDSKTLTICLDKNSPLLSESEGIPLFTEVGAETDYLQTRKMLLSEIFEGEKITDQFAQKISELQLLTPFELIMQPENEEARKVTGMYSIDENKLKALSPEQLLELHKLDFLAACYLIRTSIFQMHNLMMLRNRKSGERAAYRIELQPQPIPVA